MIQLDIDHREITLPVEHQGLATGAYTRAALVAIFADEIEADWVRTSRNLTLHETTLDRMIVRYSEQAAFQPLREIRHWFTYNSGAFIEPGYPRLYYAKRPNQPISPNKSAVCAVGEGVAGFLAQRLYQCTKLARPNHDYPDIVMEADNCTYLVESKATIAGDAENISCAEFPRIASMTVSAKLMDIRPVIGVLVSTTLMSETQYHCIVQKVTLAP